MKESENSTSVSDVLDGELIYGSSTERSMERNGKGGKRPGQQIFQLISFAFLHSKIRINIDVPTTSSAGSIRVSDYRPAPPNGERTLEEQSLPSREPVLALPSFDLASSSANTPSFRLLHQYSVTDRWRTRRSTSTWLIDIALLRFGESPKLRRKELSLECEVSYEMMTRVRAYRLRCSGYLTGSRKGTEISVKVSKASMAEDTTTPRIGSVGVRILW